MPAPLINKASSKLIGLLRPLSSCPELGIFQKACHRGRGGRIVQSQAAGLSKASYRLGKMRTERVGHSMEVF